MKKSLCVSLLLITLCSVAVFAGNPRCILSRTSSSITFEVDRGLPAPENLMKYPMPPGIIAERVAEHAYNPGNKTVIVAKSFDSDSLFYMGENVMFKTFIRCYAEHRPLVLSPDMVWLMISQALSHQVNQNPDQLRDQLVAFEGKKELIIHSDFHYDDPRMDWAGAIDKFTSEIGDNTRGAFTGLKADFSTTGTTERIVSEITLMDAVKPYFDYKMMMISCGVPSVTLEGTPADWKRLLSKAGKLSDYGLGWWLDELRPVLKQFVAASKGRPDTAFWQNMVMTLNPGEVRGPSCSLKPVPMTEFDGWFLKFFPFDKEGRTPEKVTMTHPMLFSTVCVPLTFVVSDGANEIESTLLELQAGFIGVEQDVESYAIRPKMGWIVSKEGPERYPGMSIPPLR